MGILRLYLALCVVAVHAGSGGSLLWWLIHDGQQAVQAFFVISGFYMAMVVSNYKSAKTFYLSRAWRIFIPYYIVLVATIIVSVAFGLLDDRWLLLKPYTDNTSKHNGVAGIVLAAGTNITIVGQDLVMFLSHPRDGLVQFTSNFRQDPYPLWRYLLIPQCWSVAIEIAFYASAPWLLKLRTHWLSLLALSSIALRFAAYYQFGIAQDPWVYRFLPFEISMFVIGILSFRAYKRTPMVAMPLLSAGTLPIMKCVYAAILILLLYMHNLASLRLAECLGAANGLFISSASWGLFIPVLFAVSKNSRLDREIGELSYPIYLVHYTIIAAISPMLYDALSIQGRAAVCAVFSILIALIFVKGVIQPLDMKRHSLYRTT